MAECVESIGRPSLYVTGTNGDRSDLTVNVTFPDGATATIVLKPACGLFPLNCIQVQHTSQSVTVRMPGV